MKQFQAPENSDVPFVTIHDTSTSSLGLALDDEAQNGDSSNVPHVPQPVSTSISGHVANKSKAKLKQPGPRPVLKVTPSASVQADYWHDSAGPWQGQWKATTPKPQVSSSKYRPRVAGEGLNLPLEILRCMSEWFSVLEDRGTVPGTSMGSLMGCVSSFEDSLTSAPLSISVSEFVLTLSSPRKDPYNAFTIVCAFRILSYRGTDVSYCPQCLQCSYQV